MKLIIPRADLILFTSKRYLCKTRSIKPLIKDGKKYCGWCGQVEIPANRKYCSQDCIDSSDIYCFPHSNIAKKFYIQQQQYKCAGCGFDFSGATPKAIWKDKFFLPVFQEECRHLYGKILELHHIVPIQDGGNGVGFEMAMLCSDCHKKESKK